MIKVAQTDLDTLRGMETQIAEAEQEIARAERAGFDVTEPRKKLEEAKRLRAGILREYG